MPLGARLIEVAMDLMSRGLSTVPAIILLVLAGATGEASAQAGCQPTIMQPCTNVQPQKPVAQPPKRATSDTPSDEPKDHSPRVKLDQDTDFKFGTGGIGIGRKF
jgi:hypothetical protein